MRGVRMAGVVMSLMALMNGCGGWRPGPELELPRGVKLVAVLGDTVVMSADESVWHFASSSFVGDSVMLVAQSDDSERQVSHSVAAKFAMNEYTDVYYEDEQGMHAELLSDGPPPYVSAQAQADWAVEHQGSFSRTAMEFILISSSTRDEYERCRYLTASPNKIVHDLAKELPGAAVDDEGTVYNADGKAIGFESNPEEQKDGRVYYIILPDRTDDD